MSTASRAKPSTWCSTRSHERSPISPRGFHDELVGGYGWAPPVAAVIPYLPAISQAQDDQIPAVTRVEELAKGMHNLADFLFPGSDAWRHGRQEWASQQEPAAYSSSSALLAEEELRCLRMETANGKGLASLYDLAQATGRAQSMMTCEKRSPTKSSTRSTGSSRWMCLRSPSEADRQRIQERINALVGLAFRRNNAYSSYQTDSALAAELGRRLMGLGFLDLLLPPARTDLSEICIYSSGLVQVMKKNNVRWETLPDLKPDPGEINRVLDRLLGPQNKSLNEANPSINAKLPATPHNPGGGRVKALHPVIVPPGRNPSINIRLFEQKPVLPEWILERGMMSAEMMDLLQTAMEQGYRILITGGTRTGKTTLLSALCNFLPSAWRIVKIEDPEEIWIDRPTVQTIEARPAAIGTEIQSYTLANGVDDALRMSPDYLILGEVRDGQAGLSLFRAMMTGHSGACYLPC